MSTTIVDLTSFDTNAEVALAAWLEEDGNRNTEWQIKAFLDGWNAAKNNER